MLRILTLIAKTTLLELLHNRFFYFGLSLSGGLLLLAMFAGLTAGDQGDRVFFHISNLMIQWSCLALCLVLGVSVLTTEFDRGTSKLWFVRPVSSHLFIIGKWGGMLSGLILQLLLVFFVFYFVAFLSGFFDQWSNSQLNQLFVLLFLTLEKLILFSAIVLALGAIFGTWLSGSLALTLLVFGLNMSVFKWALNQAGLSPFLKKSIETLTAIFPNFEQYQLGFGVYYGEMFVRSKLQFVSAYTLVFSAFWIFIAGWFLEKRR